MRLCEGCEESYNFNLVGSLDNARLGNGVRMGQVYGCWCNNNQLLNIHKLTPKMNSQFCVMTLHFLGAVNIHYSTICTCVHVSPPSITSEAGGGGQDIPTLVMNS